METQACSEHLFSAISSAFALIACSDAELAESETERFKEVLRHAEPCQGLDLDALEHDFLELARLLLTDYEQGRNRAFTAIEKVKDDPESRARVVAAAQVAIVADGALRAIEERVLADICVTLGMDPDEH